MRSKNFLSHSLLKVWISAFRLRTLPLALSSIFVGCGLAKFDGFFNWPIFILALITALLLQLLSNLANDLGDTLSGADCAERVGPERAVQSGLISTVAMMRAIYLVVLLALFSGSCLIWLAFQGELFSLVVFAALGAAAIVAAIAYTMGAKPYGYQGLGDLAVFIFFGLVGVLGSYYLFHHSFSVWHCLPASFSGLLAAAVLNINNIRDEKSDSLTGKQTLVVKMGGEAARRYHLGLVTLALLCCGIFLIFRQPTSFAWLAFLALPWLLSTSYQVFISYDSEVLNRCLKHTALAALCFNSLFAVGIQFNFS